MKKEYQILIVIASILVVGIIILFLNYYQIDVLVVNDFESCVKAGNPIMESYPRQCRHEEKTYVEDISDDLDKYFADEIYRRGIEIGGGMPIEGFNPELYKNVFPNLVDSDFDRTLAIGGVWRFENNELKWIQDAPGGIVTSADGTLTNEGLNTLLDNLQSRFKIEVNNRGEINNILDLIEEKVKVFCNDEDRKGDFCITLYDPVCGWSDPDKIKCITYPCASTYSNSCFACQDENVLYWTQGECLE